MSSEILKGIKGVFFLNNLFLDKNDNESFFEYKLRICDYKEKNSKSFTWDEVANTLNKYSDIAKGSSAYRKWYTAFNEGRIYERSEINNGVACRILSISDLHIPFQLPIETFSGYANMVDILQINGDILDMASCSKFDKVYRSSPMEEIITARKYVSDLIRTIKPKSVHVIYGNHDIRFERYLAKNLDNDVLELMPKTPLSLIFCDGFRRYDKLTGEDTWYKPLVEVFPEIEIVYHNNWYCQIGKTIFAHPSAFSSGILKTAEKALYFFRNNGEVFTSLVMAHTHRLGEYVIGNSTIYEQGCCCDVDKMTYSDGTLVNSQKEGYIYICQDSNGEVIRDKTKLVLIK